MPLRCEDLADYGVVLIPPSKTEYFDLLVDIEDRLRGRPKGSPPIDEETLSRISEHDRRSAILLNRSELAIASLAYIWWFRGMHGRTVPHSSTPGSNVSVLLPFGLDGRAMKFKVFWNTIFPGSKRLMIGDGPVLGDNTDVRPPSADELWHGGFFYVGGLDVNTDEPLKITLDGVFFVDGGFAGPNLLGSWEQTVFAAEAHLACAALAREARLNSRPPEEFFLDVRQLTGATDERSFPVPPPPSAAPDPEAIRRRELQMVGCNVLGWRQRVGDEAVIAGVAGWADAPVPKFHKLRP